jgi:hypothetical protein
MPGIKIDKPFAIITRAYCYLKTLIKIVIVLVCPQPSINQIEGAF